jgi:hypothetical protein
MLERFFEIKDFIDTSDRALAVNLPSGLEVVTLQEVMKDLEEFESATKLLQDSKRALLEVRAIFDGLMETYPSMHHYISGESKFELERITNRTFENTSVLRVSYLIFLTPSYSVLI